MVHIIGAGPSGSIAAISALRAGHEVTVSEEHPCAGIPENCSGLFSLDGLESLSPFFDYRKVALNAICGADIYFAGTRLSVRRDNPVGYVCSRSELDSLLASKAESEGASVRYGHRVNGNYLSHTLIGADGPTSSVAVKFSMGRIPRYATTLQASVPYKPEDPHMVEVFLSSELFPGFFGWVIPQDEYTAEIGVGVSMPNDVLRAWEHMLRLKGLEWTKPRGWTIPLGCRPTTGARKGKHKVLLVGDAAGQVKATTGGGVIFGGHCASVAGKHATNPELYEMEWRMRYGPDLSMHRHISSYLASLSDDGLSDLGRKLNRINCGEFLSNHGHMDKPTRMLGPGMIAHLIKNIAGVS
jgi:flavin-dependent dehydrogenase